MRAVVLLVEMRRAVPAALMLVAVILALSACGGVQGGGEFQPDPSGWPQTPPLSTPVTLSIISLRTAKAHGRVPEVGETPLAFHGGDSKLSFPLATSSCDPVGVSAYAEGRTLHLRLRPNHASCEGTLRVVNVGVTLSRPVLRTNAITQVAVTYAPPHSACRAGTCPRPRAELLPLTWPVL